MSWALRFSTLFVFLTLVFSCIGSVVLFTALTLRNEGFLDYDPNPLLRTQTAILLMLSTMGIAGVLWAMRKNIRSRTVWYMLLLPLTLSFALSLYVFMQVYQRYV